MDRLAMGSTGACPSEKQQLESIKIWPGQARPLASPALSLFAWLSTSPLVLPAGLTLWNGDQCAASPRADCMASFFSWRYIFIRTRQGESGTCTCHACRMCNPILMGSNAAVSASPGNVFIAPGTHVHWTNALASSAWAESMPLLLY